MTPPPSAPSAAPANSANTSSPTTNKDKDPHEEENQNIAALRQTILTHKTTPSSTTKDDTTSTNNNNTGVAKNMAGVYARQMLKSSWIGQTDAKLQMDLIPVVEGGCIYLPGFLCPSTDYALLKNLTADLQHTHTHGHDASGTGGSSFINWSQHLKFENPSFSPTFQSILARLETYFNVEILATRLNFYRDGSDWKPFHHDSHAYGHGGKKEDFTMGASFGSTRELAFRHEISGMQFNFPQGNGDIFAFDSDVNKAFKHGVPKCKGNPANVGPRFSIIAWGRRRSLNEKNSSVSMREADQGQREWEERERGGGYTHTHTHTHGGGGKKAHAHTKKGVEEEEEKEEKVSPIGMEEVVALVEKMVVKEEEKQRSKGLPSSSCSSNKHTHTQSKENSNNKKAPAKGKGGGGEEKGNTDASATDGCVGVEAEEGGKKKGRTRRGGRVQHSWACS